MDRTRPDKYCNVLTKDGGSARDVLNACGRLPNCQVGLKNGAHSRYAYQPAAFIIAAPVGALAATRDREAGVQQQQEQRPE